MYSDADRNSRHVELADDAYHLGPPPAAESYLRIDKILTAARDTNAQAIHPGYGFLSENAEFAQRCAQDDIVFVGPPGDAIQNMASKKAARYLMETSGVPVIPGFSGSQDASILKAEALRIGFPVLIKPVMGGGGIGMTVAHDVSEFEGALRSSKKEAIKSFGNDDVLLERWLQSSRHVEVQIVADWKGNVVHLHERDCSVQRRHQKIIEEAPAPLLSVSMRSRMGEAAIAAARAVDYRNCGTVEFLVDTANSDKTERGFYFLEMNTRLQVEHPVTEMITGVDLVEWQLRIAAGEELPSKSQADIKCRGHAMEARIYAESPSSGFLPQAGKIKSLAFPADFLPISSSGEVRVDSGVKSDAGDISMYYDPMFAKVIAWGETREAARRGLSQALGNSSAFGVQTNIDFVARILNTEEFAHADFDSGLLQKYPDISTGVPLDKGRLAESAIATATALQSLIAATAPIPKNFESEFDALAGFRVNGPCSFSLSLEPEEGSESGFSKVEVAVYQSHDGLEPVKCEVNFDSSSTVLHSEVQVEKIGNVGGNSSTVVPVQLRWLSDAGHGQSPRETFFVEFQDFEVLVHRQQFDKYSGDLKTRFRIPIHETTYTSYEGRPRVDESAVVSPMPGRVSRLFVCEGDKVRTGDVLLEIEAMKMTHVLRAPFNSTVMKINAKNSGTVDDSTVLVQLKREEVEV